MSLPIAAVYDSRAPGDPVSVQIPKGQRDQYFSILLTSYRVNGPHLLGSSTVTIKWLRSSTNIVTFYPVCLSIENVQIGHKNGNLSSCLFG